MRPLPRRVTLARQAAALRALVRLMVVALLAGSISYPARAADRLHHRAELRLRPADGSLEAVDRVAWPDSEPSPASDFPLVRLAAGLELRSAAIDGRAVGSRRTADGWVLDRTIPPGAVLELRYGGRLPTDAATAPPPFLGPEGGFLPAGTGWLPALSGVPRSADPGTTFELTLEVPSPMKVVATGRLASEGEAGGIHRARFVGEHPSEGPSAFVGPYRIAERGTGAVPVRTYLYEADTGLADLYLERAQAYLGLYAERIGPYPYDGFRIVAAPIPVGLGFAGLTYVSRRILPLPFMQTTSLAHEVLHSWWGNAVEVDYAAGNWAEGLTTYMADHALAEAGGPGQAAALRLAWLRDFAALPSARDVPLRRFVSKEHDAGQVVGYGKGAFVFHMLRRRLGDAGFDAGIGRFYRDHRFRAAAWADLERSFVAATGQDLQRFFAAWTLRPGAPRLHLDEAEVRRTDAGLAVELALRQEEPPWPLRVPVAIVTDGGEERHVVALDGPRVTASLPVRGPPRRVTVDPDHDVFRLLAPGEAPPILRDVTLRPDTALLIAAKDESARAAARRLAALLLGTADPPRPATTLPSGSPLLVIGLTPHVAPGLAAAGLPATPPAVAGRGTARVWTARLGSDAGLLVVEADDPAALAALARPLPHYRRDSWLVFEGGRLVERGVWPTADSPLSRRLESLD